MAAKNLKIDQLELDISNPRFNKAGPAKRRRCSGSSRTRMQSWRIWRKASQKMASTRWIGFSSSNQPNGRGDTLLSKETAELHL